MTEVIALIGRAHRYSPRNIANDRNILAAVEKELRQHGYECHVPVNEDEVISLPDADIYVSMGRSERLLDLLSEKEQQGRKVLNSTDSVRGCNHRSRLMMLLEKRGVSVPPLWGDDGYWVKRGVGCRETDADVQYAADRQQAEACRLQMMQRGISEVDVRAHINGTWYKFYGVGTAFFRCYQVQNGQMQALDEPLRFSGMAQKAAQVAGLKVYGGDIISNSEDSEVYVVDLNDWPSFSACRQEAAEAIACEVIKEIGYRRL